MTRNENKPSIAAVKELMGANRDQLREIVQDLLQEMLEGEMTEALGAAKSERSDGRIGYRSGHYNRTLITRVRFRHLATVLGLIPCRLASALRLS